MPVVFPYRLNSQRELEHIYPTMSVQSFNAVCDERTHTLILGSMPGVASLDAVEYYAHRRNAFWPIMLAMLDNVTPDYSLTEALPYPQRMKKLLSHGIGLWDVIASCERSGSLDSAIKAESVRLNDFQGLFKRYPAIKSVGFNGKTAQRLFNRHMLPKLEQAEAIRWLDLPSSSPAMASLSLQQKSAIWTEAINLKSQSPTQQ